MNEEVKILIDECVGKPLSDVIGQLLSFREPEAVQVMHVQDFRKVNESGKELGKDDDDWIPQVAKEGWILITPDLGKNNRGAKLPLLCKAFGVTYVLMSQNLHRGRKQLEKACAILAVKDKIIGLASVPKGSEYFLRIGSAGGYQLISEEERKRRNQALRQKRLRELERRGTVNTRFQPPLPGT